MTGLEVIVLLVVFAWIAALRAADWLLSRRELRQDARDVLRRQNADDNHGFND